MNQPITINSEIARQEYDLRALRHVLWFRPAGTALPGPVVMPIQITIDPRCMNRHEQEPKSDPEQDQEQAAGT